MMIGKLLYFGVSVVALGLTATAHATILTPTLDHLKDGADKLETTYDLISLNDNTPSETAVRVSIGGQMYYFEPDTDQYALLATLSGTAASELIESTDGIFRLNGKLYDFNLKSIPDSNYVLKESPNDYTIVYARTQEDGSVSRQYFVAEYGMPYAQSPSTMTNTKDTNHISQSFLHFKDSALINGSYLAPATIETVTGDFIGNSITDNTMPSIAGAGILNLGSSYIGNITGDFVANKLIVSDGEGHAYGAAIANYGQIGDPEEFTSGDIHGNFLGNMISNAAGVAQGGAIYNSGSRVLTILNSNFIGNVAQGSSGSAGGAIFSYGSLHIVADSLDSIFSGNSVQLNSKSKDADSDTISNAIYMASDSAENLVDLHLTARNGGNLIFEDAISGGLLDGTETALYNLHISGNGEDETDQQSGFVRFYNTVNYVNDLKLDQTAQMELGIYAQMNVENMQITSVNGSTSSPLIKLDLKADAENKTVTTGLFNVLGDVSGYYNVVINALSKDTFEGAESLFLEAPNDDFSTASGFNVRQEGNPYLWKGRVEQDETSGTKWYVYWDGVAGADDADTDTEMPNLQPVLTPEVVAGAALHEAAVEQTRSLASNVAAQTAVRPTKTNDIGVLRQAWAYVEGHKSTIKKPINVDAEIAGVDTGFDFQRDGQNTLGVLVSYRHGKYDIEGGYSDGQTASTSINSYTGGVYYRYEQDRKRAFVMAYAGRQKAKLKSDDGVASLKTKGFQYGAAAEIGYSFRLKPQLSLDPSLGLNYTQINFNDARDNLGKRYKWDNIRHVEAEAGLALTKHYADASIYLKPSVIQTFTNTDKFSVTGLNNKVDTYKNQTLGRIEIGGRYDISESFSIYGRGAYTIGSRYEAVSGHVGLSYAW